MRVVCVIDSWHSFTEVTWRCPKKDDVCTVVDTENKYGGLYYILAGFGEFRFTAENFRPLDETFADEVLERIKEEINEEQLVRI